MKLCAVFMTLSRNSALRTILYLRLLNRPPFVETFILMLYVPVVHIVLQLSLISRIRNIYILKKLRRPVPRGPLVRLFSRENLRHTLLPESLHHSVYAECPRSVGTHLTRMRPCLREDCRAAVAQEVVRQELVRKCLPQHCQKLVRLPIR